MPTTATSDADLAQSYGFAYSFMMSDPELHKLFLQAKKEGWDGQHWQVKLQASPWYQKQAAAVRNYKFALANDPASLAARKSALIAQIQDSARQMGATMGSALLNTVATNALMYGWNDAQTRNVLAGYVKAVNGQYAGSASDDVEALRQTAWRNGIHLSSSTIQGYASSIARGDSTLSALQNHVRGMAKTLAPAFAAQLDSGMDLYDIANPYIQSKAKILEKNPAEVDLYDPDIRNALSATGKDGKPVGKSLWQFEQELKKKPEWLKTQNAQDQTQAVAHQVLNDFGFMRG